MNLKEIVEQEIGLLEKLIEPVRTKLFKALDDDEDYSLNTDEMTELVDNMIVEYINEKELEVIDYD